MDKQYQFWVSWLYWVAVIAAAFGVILALGYSSPLFGWMRLGINAPFFASAEVPPAVERMQGFMVALMGAVMAAWSLMIACVARWPLQQRERWAWLASASSVLTWFLLDESFSIYYQVYFNAVFNLVFLAALALPLWFTRQAFFKSKAARAKMA